MRIRHALPLAAALMLSVVSAQAQTPETTPDKQDSHSTGTAPEGRSSTGWTGGTGGSHIGTNTQEEKSTSGQAPAQQPVDSTQTPNTGQGGATPSDGPPGLETATGKDLQGPPKQFPTNKTPE